MKINIKALIIFFSATMTFMFLFAGTIRNDVAVSKYLNFANEQKFDPVCAITDRTGRIIASGVLISPSHVITAAHTTLLDSSEVYCQIKGEKFRIRRTVKYPEYKFERKAVDLAIVELQRPVKDVAPAEINRELNELGQKAYISGFGIIQVAGMLPTLKAEGHKLAGVNNIDSIGSYVEKIKADSRLFIDFDKPGDKSCNAIRSGSPKPLSMEFMNTGGDSGGGLFIKSNGKFKLAGIVQAVSNFNSKRGFGYGTIGIFTRVSVFADWVDRVISGHS